MVKQSSRFRSSHKYFLRSLALNADKKIERALDVKPLFENVIVSL